MTEDKINELDMNQPRFLVGQVASLIGVHPQTVRYFDSKGIAIPQKDSATGRRKYSMYDIYKITLRNQYQNIGFSVAETEELFKREDIGKIVEELGNKKSELEQVRLALEMKQAGIAHLMERMERIDFCLNKCFYMKKPAVWRRTHIINGKYAEDEGSLQARRLGIKNMPLCVYSYHFDYEDILSDPGGINYRWDMTLPDEYASKIGFDKIPGSYYEPEKQCLYTIFIVEGTLPIRWEMIENIVGDFMKSNNLSLAGDVEGTIIINTYDEQASQKRYMDAYIPVK
ncbi:MAG: MerR family transcriptional regulator [Eubacteriaceae bacterium]|nr:MerR family transcriptional regulator [Eubacteriaceae bacterium]